MLGQKTDTAVYCPHTEGLWKVSAKSESWQGGLSLICLYSSSGREREGLGVLLCLLSAATKTFVNWKLRNQKPDLNETCLIYVPFQHLSFPKKLRRQWLGGGGGASKNPPKNYQKIYKTLTLTLPKSSLKNAIKVVFFSTVILSKLMAN